MTGTGKDGRTRREENGRDAGRVEGMLALARVAVELTGLGRVVARFDAQSWVFGDDGIELSEVEKRIEDLPRRLDAVAAVEEAEAQVKEQLHGLCREIRKEWEEKCEAACEAAEELVELGHDMCSGACSEE